jgi:hypothetical protein
VGCYPVRSRLSLVWLGAWLSRQFRGVAKKFLLGGAEGCCSGVTERSWTKFARLVETNHGVRLSSLRQLIATVKEASCRQASSLDAKLCVWPFWNGLEAVILRCAPAPAYCIPDIAAAVLAVDWRARRSRRTARVEHTSSAAIS